jgi:hypothetical protein
MKKIVSAFFLLIVIIPSCKVLIAKNVILTPAEKSSFREVSKYADIVTFIHDLDNSSSLLSVETIGHSVEGRNIFVLKFSTTTFGSDKSKIRVLIHAQQHGNEQSGKEGALLIARELLKPENRALFDHIDLAIVPQVNPDGSEKNTRRNGNNADLNRNHLIMTEPEVLALHRLFDNYLFEVTMDVHEYFPYSEDWKVLGYRRNSDILVGFNTHPLISSIIREYQLKKCWPYLSSQLESKGVSNSIYSPGGPPDIDYVRFSTFDINDGRQSYGIQNTFSFIQEGLNGEDGYVDNLAHRAYSQSQGMYFMLKFVSEHYIEMKSIIETQRRTQSLTEPLIPLRLEHMADGSKFSMPVYSYKTGRDSIVIVNDFRPKVVPTLLIHRPSGYLIPKSDSKLVDWIVRQGFDITPFSVKNPIIEELYIKSIDSIDFERDIIASANVEERVVQKSSINIGEYIYVSTKQLKGHLLIIGIEPQSELGLATYPQFSYLMKAESIYPVIRIRVKE